MSVRSKDDDNISPLYRDLDKDDDEWFDDKKEHNYSYMKNPSKSFKFKVTKKAV